MAKPAFEGGVLYEPPLADDVFIAYGTEVWLQEGDVALDLAWVRDNLPDTLEAAPLTDDSGCDTCCNGFIDGAIAPMNDEYGIERCDACDVFAGDFEAAAALAAHLERHTNQTPGSIRVWFFPDTKE